MFLNKAFRGLKIIFCALACYALMVFAQEQSEQNQKIFQNPDVVGLPEMSVYSGRTALQEPSPGAFAMPVSALAFEPFVDVQSRNMGEAQADVTIRGGTFENTGFRVGATALYDPQTGHYAAEIPIAPAMITAPQIFTGAENALASWNANAGTIASDWRRIATSGMAVAAGGDWNTWRGEAYQGWVAPESARVFGRQLAVDAAVAGARSDGSQPWGESRFARYNARLQLAGTNGAGNTGGQTDLFFGYQTKFIGWPNLYTPYKNVFETDDLKTSLVVFNHRENFGERGEGNHVSFAASWRRNKDHYVFNRADSGAYNPAFATSPSFHTSDTWSAGGEGVVSTGQIRWIATASFVADKLESTALIYGHFNTRSYGKLTLAPERTWELGGGRSLLVRAGAALDATNRDGSAWSPAGLVELRHLAPQLGVDSLYVSYSEATQVPSYTALNSKPSAGLFRGNPDLGRERSRNFEAGARGVWGAWTARLAVFYRRDGDLADWIYSTNLPNARVASAVDLDTFGVEAEARFSAKWGGLVFGYTNLSKDAQYPSGVVQPGRQIASFYALNYARHRATAALVVRPWSHWELRCDNEARWQSPNALRRSADNAVLTSLGVFFTPPKWQGVELRVFAQGANVWNSDFENVPSVPAARRQWSLGVMTAW